MRLLKGILSIFVALVVLVSANGFFIEKYLCTGCNIQHSDVAFFEFGKISHDHPHCSHCDGLDNACSCHKDEHLNHATISYFSLEQLFFSSNRADIPQIQSLEMPLPLIFSPIVYFFDKIHLTQFNVFKLPPLLKTNAGSTDFGAVISVFRL
jgi:hypothetical protein